jgi:hypothetical protein
VIDKLKRRYAHPGLYLYRTRRHMRAGTEWGYGGKSRNLELRGRCHEGVCTRHPACAGGKPWADLIVRRHTLELPWWLGWDWITLSLETIMLAVFRPRYNIQKNPRRRKVGTYVQRAQRAARDAAPAGTRRFSAEAFTDAVIRVAAVLLLVVGIGGYLWTR